jgi:hypothetical protein
MKSNWTGARKESKDWAIGIGTAVLDKKASKRIGKYANKSAKSFISDMKKSMSTKAL